MTKRIIWNIAAGAGAALWAVLLITAFALSFFDIYTSVQVIISITLLSLISSLLVAGIITAITMNKSEFNERTILDNSINGIFIVTPPFAMGNVVYVNPAFSGLFNESPDILMSDEFLPERFWAHPSERREILDVMLKEPVISNIEIRFRNAGNREWWSRLACRHVDAVSGTKIQGTLVDISESKKSEEVLKNYNETLEKEIGERTRERDEIQRVSILGLSKITEYRDPETGNHVVRMAHYSKILAILLAKSPKYRGYITEKYVDEIFISAPLHDIGKVGIEDAILKKPGKLTSDEFDIMKYHTIYGGNTLKDIEKQLSFRSFLTLGKEIAFNHHQKWDGTGYPNYPPEGGLPTLGIQGHAPLKGAEIPLSARIVAMADVYDALTSNRCYRKAFTHDEAKTVILKEMGTHFDPDIVDLFRNSEAEFVNILNRFKD